MKWKFIAMMASVIIILFFTLFFVGCIDQKLHEKNQSQAKYELAKEIVDSTIYIKNTRTKIPICFAYFWQGSHGGPATYPVPCEAIPPGQLIEVR